MNSLQVKDRGVVGKLCTLCGVGLRYCIYFKCVWRFFSYLQIRKQYFNNYYSYLNIIITVITINATYSLNSLIVFMASTSSKSRRRLNVFCVLRMVGHMVPILSV